MDSKEQKNAKNIGLFIAVLTFVTFGIAIYANILSIQVNRKALGKSR